MGLSKAHKALIREAEAAGARARIVKKNKGLMIHGPEGSAMIHTSTSDTRALANARADIKRAGIEL
jgi:hypothetical protein